MRVVCYTQFFRVHMQASCLRFAYARICPDADMHITHHVFVCNRNKIILEMLMSSCFTCDEGELQTGVFQPWF